MEEPTNTSAPHAGCLLYGTVMPLLNRMWSDATNDHFRNSRVEFLKGVRSLIDDRINHLSKNESKGTRVVVEQRSLTPAFSAPSKLRGRRSPRSTTTPSLRLLRDLCPLKPRSAAD